MIILFGNPAQRPLISLPKQEKWNREVLNRVQFKRLLKGCHYHGPDGKEDSVMASDDVFEKFIDGLKPGLNFTDKFGLNVDCCDLIIYCLKDLDKPVYVSREQVEKVMGL